MASNSQIDMTVSAELERKRAALEKRLVESGRLLVAYSGGVDSAYLAFVAHKVLGEQMLAVIADSPSLARAQMRMRPILPGSSRSRCGGRHCRDGKARLHAQ